MDDASPAQRFMVVATIRVDTDPRKGCRLTGSRRTPAGGENARCTFLFEFLEWRFESLARSPGSLHVGGASVRRHAGTGSRGS